MRSCTVCGRQFVPRRRGHVLCSNRCSVKLWRRRHPKSPTIVCVNHTLGYICTCTRCRQLMTSADRRPWLILSAREARALLAAVIERPLVRSVDLERAMRQIDLQLRWVDGAADGEEPSQQSALRRDQETP